VTPGQRVTLIKECAQLLAVREWYEIDLVLRTFNFPTDDDGHGGTLPYVIDMLEGSPDASIQALHSYLVGEDASGPADSEPWAQGQLKLFMSHLAIHQEYVGQVGTYLSPYCVSAFVAHTSIEPSKEWEDVVEAALRTCDAMVVFLHKGFHQSNWCDQEVGFGLARRIPTLLIKLDAMPYGFMSKYQALSGRERNPFQLATSITDWLVAAPTAQSAMTESLVTALERSSSYDGTRRVMTLLRQIPRFTPQQLERLWEAAQNNGQVSDANLKVDRDYVPIPWLVKDLIVQHGGRVPAAVATDEPPF
jgi:hypothetical protein